MFSDIIFSPLMDEVLAEKFLPYLNWSEMCLYEMQKQTNRFCLLGQVVNQLKISLPWYNCLSISSYGILNFQKIRNVGLELGQAKHQSGLG